MFSIIYSGNYTKLYIIIIYSIILNKYLNFRYASLLKLHKDAALLNTLDGLLGNEALLQLDLRALTPVFKDPAKKKWFQEVIDNQIKLWEVNM